MLIEVLLFILRFSDKAFASKETMEFRKKSGNNFSHFIFYPSTTCKKTANEQNRFMVDKLGKKLRQKGISHLFGAHIYHYLRQCGFNDDTCVSSHCEEQSGEKHYGECPVINPPTSLDATSNHIHLLIYCNNASQSSTFGMSAYETQGVNGTLERAVQTVREFSGQRLCTEGLSGFQVIQKQVWCPFSIFAVFCSHQNSFTSIYGEVFLKTFKKARISNSDHRRHFPKRSPVLRSKTLWEIHCHNMRGTTWRRSSQNLVCAYCMKHTQREGECI